MESGQSKIASSILGKSSKWTMAHSYYAVKGGFAFSPQKYNLSFLKSEEYMSDFLVLTPPGVELLAQLDIEVPTAISKADINDKAKSNSLQKALVCAQAAWFCVQCVFRLAQGLSISLLELNTFAHALCALLVYLLWWNKPLDIEQPTILPWAKWPGFIAWVKSWHDKDFPLPCLAGTPLLHFSLVKVNQQHRERAVEAAGRFRAADSTAVPADGKTRYYEGETLNGLTIMVTETWLREIGAESASWVQYGDSSQNYSIDLSPEQLLVVELLGKFIEECGYPKTNAPQGRRYKTAAPNKPGRIDYTDNLTLHLGVALIMAGLAYDGLHLAAWNAYFPHPVEQILWRIAGVAVAASGFICIVCLLLVGFLEYIDRALGLAENMALLYVGYFFIVAVIPFLFYSFCRVYLVVESYRNLAFLSPSAFEVPDWSRYFPHIG
jgi:hypothetical protein